MSECLDCHTSSRGRCALHDGPPEYHTVYPMKVEVTGPLVQELQRLQMETERLKEENRGLREALAEVADAHCQIQCQPARGVHVLRCAVARAALNPKTGSRE